MGNFTSFFPVLRLIFKSVVFFFYSDLEINSTVFKFYRKVRIVGFKSDYTALSSYVTEMEKSNCYLSTLITHEYHLVKVLKTH